MSRLARIERDVCLALDESRSRTEALETSLRAIRRALRAEASLGGRGGGRPTTRTEHAADEALLSGQIAEVLADGVARTAEAITAAIRADGIAVERPAVAALLHLDVARADGRFVRAGHRFMFRLRSGETGAAPGDTGNARVEGGRKLPL